MPSGLNSRALVHPRTALFFTALGLGAALLTGCGEKPVATVNGDPLTEKEFSRLCETATGIQPNIPVGPQVLAKWIQSTIFAQQARKLKVYPSDKDLEARVASMAKQAEYGGGTLDDFLKQRAMTRDVFRQEQLRTLIQENVITQGVTVTDAEVKDFFDKQKPNLVQPERIEISQITLDSEEQVKKAKDDLASGDFAVVASTRSKDTFAQGGGRVPMPLTNPVQPGLGVDQKVVDAAFKLKEGQISDPIKVGSTWVIVRLEKKMARKEPKLDDFSEFFRAELKKQKAMQGGNAQKVQQSLMEATRTANVQINRPEYKQLQQELQSVISRGPAGAGGGEMPPGIPGGG